jgi:ribose transport system ATP-binding protein
VAEVTRKEMIAKMIGREQTNEFPPRPECVKDEVILSVEDLCTNRLHHISFELKKGEILGLAGLDGAGRTLIARAIFGADKRTSGKICIEGKEVQIRNTRDAIKAGMGFITEDRKEQGLVLNASVEQNISIASLNNILGGHLLNKEKERKMAEKYVDALDIKTPSLRQKVILLSGGNQQKCIIGRWCEIEPKILIMDEPTRGIDVSAKYEIYVIMKNLVESGNSIIFISSDLSEIMNMSNRVLTVSEGALTGEFDPRVLTADTIMDAAFK